MHDWLVIMMMYSIMIYMGTFIVWVAVQRKLNCTVGRYRCDELWTCAYTRTGLIVRCEWSGSIATRFDLYNDLYNDHLEKEDILILLPGLSYKELLIDKLIDCKYLQGKTELKQRIGGSCKVWYKYVFVLKTGPLYMPCMYIRTKQPTLQNILYSCHNFTGVCSVKGLSGFDICQILIYVYIYIAFLLVSSILF